MAPCACQHYELFTGNATATDMPNIIGASLLSPTSHRHARNFSAPARALAMPHRCLVLVRWTRPFFLGVALIDWRWSSSINKRHHEGKDLVHETSTVSRPLSEYKRNGHVRKTNVLSNVYTCVHAPNSSEDGEKNLLIVHVWLLLVQLQLASYTFSFCHHLW